MSHHVVPFKTNLWTFVSLVVLTILTVLTAKFVDLGSYNLLLAMFIASVKVGIVLLWFMHLKYDGFANRAIIGSTLFFLVLFFAFSAFDQFFR